MELDHGPKVVPLQFELNEGSELDITTSEKAERRASCQLLPFYIIPPPRHRSRRRLVQTLFVACGAAARLSLANNGQLN